MSDLIINNVPRFATYTATAGQTVFNVPFPYDASGAVRIRKVAALDGTVTNYPADGALAVSPDTGDQGVVTLPTACAVNDQIIVYGETTLTRAVHYSQTAKPSALNNDGNRLVLLVQELKRDLGRALLAPMGSDGGSLGDAEDIAAVIENLDAITGAPAAALAAAASEAATGADRLQTGIDAAAATSARDSVADSADTIARTDRDLSSTFDVRFQLSVDEPETVYMNQAGQRIGFLDDEDRVRWYRAGSYRTMTDTDEAQEVGGSVTRIFGAFVQTVDEEVLDPVLVSADDYRIGG